MGKFMIIVTRYRWIRHIKPQSKSGNTEEAGMGKLMVATARYGLPILYFLLACSIAFVLECYVEYIVGKDEQNHTPLAESIFNLRDLYQRLVTAGPRKPIQKFTVPIELSDNPLLDPHYFSRSGNVRNLCGRRKALADLIDKIASANPAMIVVDKVFHKDECPQDDPGTKSLQNVVKKVVSAKIPFVVGVQMMGSSESERYLYPSLAFLHNDSNLLKEGFLEIDPDTRKLPLNWAVHPDAWRQKQGPPWELRETLSLKAAKAWDSELVKKDGRLNKLVTDPLSFPRDATHPYISFIENLKVYKAGEILCGDNCTATQREDQSKDQCKDQCKDHLNTLEDLRGKIVLIGERHEGDEHLSVLGLVPGFILQANYIEALLDQRYFNPAPWLDYILAFIIYAFILIGLHFFDNFWWTLGCWLATLIVAYLLIYTCIIRFGYYVNPVAITGLALLINSSHLLFSTLYHSLRKKL